MVVLFLLLVVSQMDMLTVDLGEDSQDKVGDEVILWGKELPIETVAKYSGIFKL